MRVIAGKFRGRSLRSAPGFDVRPTSDRLRETLFNVLTAGNPMVLEGTVWVDLYAGSGAVGIEAISRGAAMVYFIDVAAKSANVITHNLHSLELTAGIEVLKQDAVKGLRLLESRKVMADFVFLDPPYKLEDEYQKTLNALARSSLLKPQSLVIAEHFTKFDPGEAADSLVRYRKLEQGDGALSFYRRNFF